MEDQNSGFQDFLAVAQLGTQTFLANQTITSSRPSTYAVSPNGQMIVSGGGAPSPAVGIFGPGFSGSILLWILALLLILVFVFRRK